MCWCMRSAIISASRTRTWRESRLVRRESLPGSAPGLTQRAATSRASTAMTSYKLFLLAGDGIGPEGMGELKAIVSWFNSEGIARFEIEQGLVGGAAYDAHGEAISESDMARAQASDAVLFGAVGGPKWDSVAYDKRPEAGLLRLRKDLALYANLRPAICYPALADASSLQREGGGGFDRLLVR